MSKTTKPGQVADTSGIYDIVGPRGGKTEDQRTVDRGEKFPPTPKPGEQYKLAQRTHHRKER